MFASLLAAFLVGLGGSAHCTLMCGGISAAMVLRTDARRASLQALAAQLGRVSSYMLAGMLAAALSTSILGVLTTDVSRHLVKMLLGIAWIAMALQLLGYWRQGKFAARIGYGFWNHLRPLSKRLWPIDSVARAFTAGAIWGWLPCGMSYGMVLVAAASASVEHAALLMGAFGLGTVPTLLIPALVATKLQKFSLNPKVKKVVAALMIVFGLFTALSPWLVIASHHHHPI